MSYNAKGIAKGIATGISSTKFDYARSIKSRLQNLPLLINESLIHIYILTTAAINLKLRAQRLLRLRDQIFELPVHVSDRFVGDLLLPRLAFDVLLRFGTDAGCAAGSAVQRSAG